MHTLVIQYLFVGCQIALYLWIKEVEEKCNSTSKKKKYITATYITVVI